MIYHYLGVMAAPVYCTKIASRLARTFTDRHGLRDLCKDLLDVDLSKQQQSSDWGAADLTDEQLRYAASDVLHLHALRAKLDAMLAREGRIELAGACFRFPAGIASCLTSKAGRSKTSSHIELSARRCRREAPWGCRISGGQ